MNNLRKKKNSNRDGPDLLDELHNLKANFRAEPKTRGPLKIARVQNSKNKLEGLEAGRSKHRAEDSQLNK